MKKINKLNEALNQFSLASKILKEDYGMAPGMGYDEKQITDPEGGEDIAHYRGNEGEEQQPQEEQNTDMNLSKSDERIAQIREIALNGLQDYAQDVDCEAYQFYKKIWLMCDKAVSEKDSASNGSSVG